MRDMVIIFLVLLAILILVSAFGGCIRFKENYHNDIPGTTDDYNLLSEHLKPWETNPVFAPAPEYVVDEEDKSDIIIPSRVMWDPEQSIDEEETQEISGVTSTPMSIGGGVEFAEID